MIRYTTFSREQLQKWEAIVTSNPARVVRLIGHATTSTFRTREGDTNDDVIPALSAIMLTVHSGSPACTGSEWQSLVKAGVVEQLCKIIALRTGDMVTTVTASDPVSKSLDVIHSPMPSPYHLCIDILGRAIGFTKARNLTTTAACHKLVSTIKKHWNTIAKHIWDHPFHSLDSVDAYAPARCSYAVMCMTMAALDTSIYQLYHDSQNLTMSNIARYWKFSSTSMDVSMNTRALNDFLSVQTPAKRRYIRTHGAPDLAVLLSHIYRAVGPKPTSTLSTQAPALIVIAARHLEGLRNDTPSSRSILLEFIHTLRIVSKEPAGRKLLLDAAIRKCALLWTTCVAILRAVPDDPAPEHTTEVIVILDLMTNTMHDAQDSAGNALVERKALLKTWMGAGLVNAIEQKIEILILMPDFDVQLAQIAMAIHETVLEFPELKSGLLKSEFPRWDISAAAMIRLTKMGETQTHKSPRQFHKFSGEYMSTLRAIYTWLALEKCCIDANKCMRRTCQKECHWTCDCLLVFYCSESCQARDAKGHGVLCGTMDFITDRFPAMVEGIPELLRMKSTS